KCLGIRVAVQRRSGARRTVDQDEGNFRAMEPTLEFVSVRAGPQIRERDDRGHGTEPFLLSRSLSLRASSFASRSLPLRASLFASRSLPLRASLFASRSLTLLGSWYSSCRRHHWYGWVCGQPSGESSQVSWRPNGVRSRNDHALPS